MINNVLIICIHILLLLCVIIWIIKHNVYNQHQYLHFQKELLKEYELALNQITNQLHDDILPLTYEMSRLLNHYKNQIEAAAFNDVRQMNFRIFEQIGNIAKTNQDNFYYQYGFITALKIWCNNTQNTTGMIMQLSILEDNSLIIDKERGLMLFRIIQEVYRNIRKHTDATIVNFNIDASNPYLSVSISDNHHKKLKVMPCNGMGMKNLATRAKLLHAKFNYNYEQQTFFNIQVPYASIYTTGT
jgi:signal transduction histidine kinase